MGPRVAASRPISIRKADTDTEVRSAGSSWAIRWVGDPLGAGVVVGYGLVGYG